MATMKMAGIPLVVMAAGWMVGCGGGPAAGVSGTAVNGNWNIVGDGSPLSDPSLSFSLVMQGSQMYAQGNFDVACNSTQGTPFGGGGGSIQLTGVLAADGTFTLSQMAGTKAILDGNALTVVVTGKDNASGTTGWTGTYSMTTPAGSAGCVVDEAGSFTAVPFAPLTGTYAGALQEGSNGTGGVSASLNITQEAAASRAIGSNTLYYLPLSATITVTGIPCFTHGGTSSSQVPNGVGVSGVAGSEAYMNFSMDDGSQIFVVGQIASTSASSIDTTLFNVHGGQCDGYYNGTLSRP